MSKNNSTAFGLGILAGVIGGVVLGVLYAPQSGEETRKQITDAASDFAQTNAPKVKKAKEEMLNKMEVLKCQFEQQYDTVTSKIKAKKMAKAKDKEEKNYEFN